MRWRRSLICLAAITVAAGPVAAAPAATAGVAAATLSLSAARALETATGTARTLTMPGGGYLVVHSYGEVSMVAADGRAVWQRSTQSLYQAWDVTWQSPTPPYTPQLPWGGDPVNPLEFAGAQSVGTVADITPFAAGQLGGRQVVAVAEVVGVELNGQACAFCAWPFSVPGSALHLGTFVTVLDASTGQMLYHELDPGYVTQLAIAGGRLIIGDETGDPQRQNGIGQWNSVTTVRALAFGPGRFSAHEAWAYSTRAPWARLLASAVTGTAQGVPGHGADPGFALAWSDTPPGLGVPGPPDGHVLLFDAQTGALRWQVRTPGYPVLLAADDARGEVAAVQLTDPEQATGYALAGLRYSDGTTAFSAPRPGSLPLALAVAPGGDWAVSAVDGKVVTSVLEYQPLRGRVTLTDPATGQDQWSVTMPGTAYGVPLPGGLLLSGGQVFVGSWLGAQRRPSSLLPITQVDRLTALSYQTGATQWQREGDTGDPLSLSAAGAGQVRAVTSTQVTQTYSADGAAAASTGAGPGDLLSAVTASVASPTSTDLVAGDEDGDVYALDGRALAGGQARVLWQVRLPGPVHQIARAVLGGRPVLVAAATSAVGVIDTTTGRLLRLIQTPGTYAYSATVARAGTRPEVVVPGVSLTAYSLASGAKLWQYPAPSGVFFSDGAYADGVVAAEYSNQSGSGPFPGTGAPATEMAAVGLNASTGSPVWVQQDPSGIENGQLWNGAIASPAIAGASGHGVAFAWQTTTGGGQVDVRDIRTGALLYSDVSANLGSHTAFLAEPGAGLIDESGQGAALITPAGAQAASLLSGQSIAAAAAADGTRAYLVGDGDQVDAYPADVFSTVTTQPAASNQTYDVGTLISGDFAGNGSEQVVALAQDMIAETVAAQETGPGPVQQPSPLQHGLAVLSLSDTSPAGVPAAQATHATAASPSAGPAGAAGQPGSVPLTPEPARSGLTQPAASPATARHTATELSPDTQPAGYAPAVMRSYLGLTGDGSGTTIVVVDAYDDPHIATDAERFSAQYGLPGVCGAGGTPGNCFTLDVSQQNPAAGDNGDWALETSLDVEWAHAIAPQARILLVEASDASFASLFSAVSVATATSPAVVSMSWGIPGEFSDETYYDHFCAVTSTVCVVSSGDYGHPGNYPADNPWVIAVGGTTLTLTGDGSVTSETAWGDSGGGQSWVEPELAAQRRVQHSGARQIPDVSFDADPSTGVAVYDSVLYEGQRGWWQVGGTSVGAPSWSAILADADQLRAARAQPPLTAARDGAQEALYALPPGFLAPISTGEPNGFCPVGCTPGPGYDEITGLGSPRAGIDAALALSGRAGPQVPAG